MEGTKILLSFPLMSCVGEQEGRVSRMLAWPTSLTSEESLVKPGMKAAWFGIRNQVKAHAQGSATYKFDTASTE